MNQNDSNWVVGWRGLKTPPTVDRRSRSVVAVVTARGGGGGHGASSRTGRPAGFSRDAAFARGVSSLFSGSSGFANSGRAAIVGFHRTRSGLAGPGRGRTFATLFRSRTARLGDAASQAARGHARAMPAAIRHRCHRGQSHRCDRNGRQKHFLHVKDLFMLGRGPFPSLGLFVPTNTSGERTEENIQQDKIFTILTKVLFYCLYYSTKNHFCLWLSEIVHTSSLSLLRGLY